MDLRYPIGPFEWRGENSAEDRRRYLDEIEEAPARLRGAVAGLDNQQLDTPYRPGGWTVRQVVHHVPDSHLNAYVRCKLAVTENHPPIKTYNEEAWAELSDVRMTPVATSLALLAALHARWVPWLRSLDAPAFARTGQHPDWGSMTVDDFISLYAWHGRHHTAHVTTLAKKMGW